MSEKGSGGKDVDKLCCPCTLPLYDRHHTASFSVLFRYPSYSRTFRHRCNAYSPDPANILTSPKKNIGVSSADIRHVTCNSRQRCIAFSITSGGSQGEEDKTCSTKYWHSFEEAFFSCEKTLLSLSWFRERRRSHFAFGTKRHNSIRQLKRHYVVWRHNQITQSGHVVMGNYDCR